MVADWDSVFFIARLIALVLMAIFATVFVTIMVLAAKK